MADIPNSTTRPTIEDTEDSTFHIDCSCLPEIPEEESCNHPNPQYVFDGNGDIAGFSCDKCGFATK